MTPTLSESLVVEIKRNTVEEQFVSCSHFTILFSYHKKSMSLQRIALFGLLSLLTTVSKSFSPTPPTQSSSTKLPSELEMTTEKPYGAWTSPITSQSITAGSVGLSTPAVDSSGDLLWLESRPQEGGRIVLCKYDPSHPDKTERNGIDVTPKDSNVRTRVHEYGGASYTLDTSDNTLYYSEFTTQRLMKMSLESNEEPTPLTPEGNAFRFADGVCDTSRNRLIMVREDHTKPEPVNVVNEVVAVDTTSGEMTVLATGNDFYAAPRISPDGSKLAYITWNHPNMPWDSTKLYVVDLNNEEYEADTESHDLVAGEDDDTSVIQPKWHPRSGELYYISDTSGYYNLYRQGLQQSILPMDVDFGGKAPGWMLGQEGYGFLNNGDIQAVISKDGSSRLLVADVSGDGPANDLKDFGMNDGLPMMFGNVVPSTTNDKELYFVGGSPSTPTSIYKWSLSSKDAATQLACSSTLTFPDEVISAPKQIEFPTTLGTAFGYYYPPCNGNFDCTTEDAPPLLVKAHGGPTACTGTAFNAGIQYWTSRGFAILDVDYGGSTGYGRDYRRRLRGAWGIVDIDDVCAGAQYLVSQGLADAKRLCIDGGSAGGYTTLGALAFRNVFTAGTSLYGVADLTALAGDTHKFESRYLDGLVGRYPEDEEIYKKRSPIESVDTLSCPILLLQGDEDEIVPPNQAEMMHEALLKKGIPTCLKMYKGEQHGFRKAENIEDALDSELSFYRQVYCIEDDSTATLEIDNLEVKV